MPSDFKSIPLINISPFLAKCDDPDVAEDGGVREVVRQLDEACREIGFFYVKGHGIPDSLLKEVRDLTRNFFHLPYDEKQKIKMTAVTGFRGYQRVGENITKGIPDMHEAIDCYREVKPGMYGDLGKTLEGSNQWPVNPSNFGLVMEEYISLLTGMVIPLNYVFLPNLARKIMRGIALALGGSPDEFEGLLTLVNQEDDISHFRLIWWNLLLKVRNRSGEWIRAVPIPGTFVCNIGDMLKIWSNGLYESTLHQVINTSPKYRVSVAYFYEPNFDAAIKPSEFCKEKTGGKEKFEQAVYGKHLVSKVLTNFVM
ncbi:hypothetical protein Scep_020206 [Stephania cephalantha]|uniref:Fe2OG dioxygenase domain-containing protein n=1 Tax=Stephania cephalantha TaxID=152367 RepID=A0AAP0NM72_9MAGN